MKKLKKTSYQTKYNNEVNKLKSRVKKYNDEKFNG